MNKFTTFKTLLIGSWLLFTPLTSLAYVIEDTNAISIDDNTALYTITYSFRFNDRPSFFPVKAKYGDVAQSDSLSYRFVHNSDADVQIEAQAAVLLSKSELNGTYYETPGATKGVYTLLAILKTPAGTPVTDFSLAITDMPFYTKLDNKLSAHGLSKDNLEEFRTENATRYGHSNPLSTSAYFIGDGTENDTEASKQ